MVMKYKRDKRHQFVALIGFIKDDDDDDDGDNDDDEG